MSVAIARLFLAVGGNSPGPRDPSGRVPRGTIRECAFAGRRGRPFRAVRRDGTPAWSMRARGTRQKSRIVTTLERRAAEATRQFQNRRRIERTKLESNAHSAVTKPLGKALSRLTLVCISRVRSGWSAPTHQGGTKDAGGANAQTLVPSTGSRNACHAGGSWAALVRGLPDGLHAGGNHGGARHPGPRCGAADGRF